MEAVEGGSKCNKGRSCLACKGVSSALRSLEQSTVMASQGTGMEQLRFFKREGNLSKELVTAGTDLLPATRTCKRADPPLTPLLHEPHISSQKPQKDVVLMSTIQ